MEVYISEIQSWSETEELQWKSICLFSELNSLDTGLLLEVWDKGMLWDKAIGYFWAPLQNLKCSKVVSAPFPSAANVLATPLSYLIA